MTNLKLNLTILLLITFISGFSQTMWNSFTPEDFEKRRERVMEEIGEGIAILQGAELTESYTKFRQDNNFYYLTGVEVPDAVLVLNGKTKRSTLLVPEHISNDIKKEARIIPGVESAEMYKLSNVMSKTMLVRLMQYFASNNQDFYLVSTPEETAEMSRDRCMEIRSARMNNPFDGRISKEANFISNISDNFPAVAIKDLSPILDQMRWVKDEKEIAALRECGRIGTLGFDEAIRVTRPAIYEYQVVAACDFVYYNEGAMGPAFLPIAASGERGLTWHYNANNHLLKAGEVILLDYAPEYDYYVTDITRTWPVKGKFTEKQLQFYNCIKEAEEKVIAMMKPGITISDMKKTAKEVYIKHGLEKYWLNYIGHFVGMSVHDVGPYDQPFVPGVVFNVEPIIEDKEMKVHLRLEDTIVITENGAENLTSQTTTEPEEIYKLMKQKGVGE